MKIPAALFVSGLLLMGCQKDPETENLPELTMEALAGNYKVKKVEFQPSSLSGYSDQTATAMDEPCEQDNYLELFPSKVAYFTDAGMVCSPSLDDEGTWNLEGKKIFIYLSNTPLFTNEAEITSWDGKVIVVVGDGPFSGSKVRMTMEKL